MGFTSGLKSAGTDRGHAMEIKAAGQTSTANLPNNPGDDYDKHKGDLWKMCLTRDFKFNGCIRKRDIEAITVVEASNDGWHIESIVTFLKAGNNYQLATLDMEVNRWIDGNDLTSKKRFELNLLLSQQTFEESKYKM